MTTGDTAASRSPLALAKPQLNFSTGIPKPAHWGNPWIANIPCSGRVCPHLRDGVCVSVLYNPHECPGGGRCIFV